MLERERFPGHARSLSVSHDRTAWKVVESPFEQYILDFIQNDPNGVLLQGLESLASMDHPLVIDEMGSITAMKELCKQFPNTKALVLKYKDYRKKLDKIADAAAGVYVVDGNLNTVDPYIKAARWLGGRKARIIFERAYGWLHYVSTSRPFYQFALSQNWELLDSQGGIFVGLTPPFEILEQRNIPVTSWLKQLDQEDIYYQYLPNFLGASHNSDGAFPYGQILLRRDSSDQQLPPL